MVVGFLVSWFSASWVLGFRFLILFASWLQRFLVSWLLVKQTFLCSKDICYILPDCHFMFFDRYRSHIQVFKILLDGSSDLLVPAFSKSVNISDFQSFEIYENNSFENAPVIFLICLRNRGVSKDN